MTLTLRGRLTLFSALLFLAAGSAILVGVYLVVEHQLSVQLSDADAEARIAALQAQAGGDAIVTMPDGSTVDLDQLAVSIREDRTAIVDAALSSLLTQGAVVVLVVAAAAAAGGWFIAGRGLRPLEAMTTTAERIARSSGAQRNLNERIELTGPDDEVKRLGDAFDAMLEALDRAFDGQRRFAASAAHQLRTPLAMERALVELEATKPDAPVELVRLAHRLLEVNETNTELIDALLILAESEQRLDAPLHADLRDAAHRAIAIVEPLATSTVTVRTDLRTAPCLGDPVLLEQLAVNLVTNAIRYNVPDGDVLVATRSEGGRAVLRVRNTGPVVAAGELPGLFEPFRRGRTVASDGRRAGFGLGLAIVKAIATAHGGAVDARPNSGGGLTITLELDEAR